LTTPARDLRPVYTAVNAEMAAVRFEEFADKWATRYPAIIKLWRSAWEEFIPFLDYDVEITEDHLRYERRRKSQPPLPASRASPGRDCCIDR
jgi:transposase-like protein